MFASLSRRNRADAEQRAVQATPWGTWPGDSGQQTWAGNTVDTTSAMRLMAVYGSVQLISSQVATLPLDRLRDKGDAPVKLALPDWLEFPQPRLHRVAWLSQVLWSLLLEGNAYLMVVRGPSGAPSSLIVLDPCVVDPRTVNGRTEFFLNGQQTRSEIVQIPGMMMPGALKGISPIEYAMQTIGAGLAAQEFSSRFFGQGATMSGVIQIPGAMDPAKTRELAKSWSRAHSGASKANLPGVLTEGAVWQATGVTQEQAQFLETRQFTAAEIAGQMFLLDPSDLGIGVAGTSLTYANLEQRNARRLQVALLPWIIRIEAALSDLLPSPQYVKFNVNAMLRGDTLGRYESYAIGITNKFMTPDEARGFEDWAPLPDDAFPEPVAPMAPASEAPPVVPAAPKFKPE